MEKPNQANGKPNNSRSRKQAAIPYTPGGKTHRPLPGVTPMAFYVDRTELAAVEAILPTLGTPHVGDAARRVFRAALVHWGELEAMDLADMNYARTEGFQCFEDYTDRIIAKAFGLKAR
jgi:hypothetical protein